MLFRSFYPVDTGGLRTPLDPDAAPLSGPPMLRRLDVETGGRTTADTNDLTLGLARAGRDLGCTYTLGFHDGEPRPDRSRRLTVLFPKRKRLRAVYPAAYVVRSPTERARSLLDTASMAPESFRSDSLWADLILSRPRSTRRWEATLAVEICLPSETGEPRAERDLRGFVRTPSATIVHSFERRIAPETLTADGQVPPGTTILEEVRVRPGRYILSAVLSDPEGGAPLATVREVIVPEIPREGPFVVQIEAEP